MRRKKWFTNLVALLAKPRALLIVWILLASLACLKQFSHSSYNNYKIFKAVFWHTVDEKNLFIEHPAEYWDTNHYGPFFSVVIAPFAVLPDWLGLLLWDVANVVFLYYAIFKLPFNESQKVGIGWLVTNELWTSLVNQQSNPAIAAGIILTFVWILSRKDYLATGLIVAGTLIKLYSIVGLAFFFFSKHKTRFIVSGVLWCVILFMIPMTFSSWSFITQSYLDWYHSLSTKDVLNQTSLYQDISLIGFTRRVSGNESMSSLYFIIPGGLLFWFAYFQKKFFSDLGFQLLVLISVMIGVNIFSSSSESSTYIIGFTAVSIWFVMHERPYPKMILYIMIFAFVLTSLSPTDLTPPFAQLFVRKYSLKALPCIIVWIYVLWQMITFRRQNQLQKEFQAN